MQTQSSKQNRRPIAKIWYVDMPTVNSFPSGRHMSKEAIGRHKHNTKENTA